MKSSVKSTYQLQGSETFKIELKYFTVSFINMYIVISNLRAMPQFFLLAND